MPVFTVGTNTSIRGESLKKIFEIIYDDEEANGFKREIDTLVQKRKSVFSKFTSRIIPSDLETNFEKYIKNIFESICKQLFDKLYEYAALTYKTDYKSPTTNKYVTIDIKDFNNRNFTYKNVIEKKVKFVRKDENEQNLDLDLLELTALFKISYDELRDLNGTISSNYEKYKNAFNGIKSMIVIPQPPLIDQPTTIGKQTTIREDLEHTFGGRTKQKRTKRKRTKRKKRKTNKRKLNS
jgi:hypothetical protein